VYQHQETRHSGTSKMSETRPTRISMSTSLALELQMMGLHVPPAQMKSTPTRHSTLQFNTLLPKGWVSKPLCFSKNNYLNLPHFATCLFVHTQMQNTHFADNQITLLALGHVWSVLRGHARYRATNWPTYWSTASLQTHICFCDVLTHSA